MKKSPGLGGFNNNNTTDEGGGARFVTRGEGTETLIVTDNTFSSNTAQGEGGGLVARIETQSVAEHRILVDGNSVTGNGGADGGGMMLLIDALELVNNQAYSLVASNNTISSSHSSSHSNSHSSSAAATATTTTLTGTKLKLTSWWT